MNEFVQCLVNVLGVTLSILCVVIFSPPDNHLIYLSGLSHLLWIRNSVREVVGGPSQC